MKTKLLLAALVAMAVSSPVFAAKAIGSCDCGEWIKDNESMKARNRSWLVGFMTGLNLADSQGRNSLGKVSGQQIFLWMDNYCKENPLKDVIDGGYDLMNELRKR